LSVPVVMPAVVTQNSAATSVLDFGDFNFDAHVEAPVTLPRAFDAFGPQADADFTNHSLNPATVAAKKPSHQSGKQSLEVLARQLFDKCLFEEAYLCGQQATVMTTIDHLSQEKRNAVDSDDLETAIKMKNAITAEQAKLSSQKQVSEWYAAADNVGVRGEALEEMVDLIMTMNPKLGGRCKTRYVDCAPSPGSDKSIRERTEFAMLAKRSMRLITATLTTHVNFPDHWAKILSFVSTSITEAKRSLDSFALLGSVDKGLALQQDKMKNFLVGMALIANVGVWVATSCTESLVNEKQASLVAAAATKLVATIQEMWPAGEQVSTVGYALYTANFLYVV
jgi:hypothetical protein